MTDFVVEEVGDLDAVWPELRQLAVELFEYHRDFWGRSLREDWEQRWKDYLRSDAERLVLIARSDGRAIAYFNAEIRRGGGIFEGDAGYIGDAYVQERFRGQGVGHEMLSRTERWFESQHVQQVRLNVAAKNALGVDFWARCGFEVETLNMSKALGVSP